MSRPAYQCERCRQPATKGDDRPWRDVGGKLVCGGCVAERELTAPAVDPTASPTEQYLAAVDAGLPLRRRQRRRVLAEVGQHLDEAAGGRGEWQAERAAVRAFGSAESLIAEYGPRRSSSRRRGRRVAIGTGLVAVAALIATVTADLVWSSHRNPAPAPRSVVRGGGGKITAFAATPSTVKLNPDGRFASCTRLAVELSRPAATVDFYIDPPGGGQWVRYVQKHHADPGHVLNFRPWCGRARTALSPGTYTWYYRVQWESGKWARSKPEHVKLTTA